MSDRKIVQVSAYASAAEDRSIEGCYALWNDGTVWEYWSTKGVWTCLPPIPQEAPDAK